MSDAEKEEIRHIQLHSAQSNQRLDVVLSDICSDLTRSKIQNLIQSGNITSDQGKRLKSSYRVKGDENIKIFIPEPEPISVQPEEIPLNIVFEDSDLIIVSKPSGMVVHPGAGHESKTLVHALLYHCNDLSGIGGKYRPGIVHRLDKGTSGIMVVAKNDKTHVSLSEQFAARQIEKKYLAVIVGIPEWDQTTVNVPIHRHPVDRKKMAVRYDGRSAKTKFKRLATADNLSVIAAYPTTGRTHQIRIHLKHAGYGILGDKIYSSGQMKRIRNKEIVNAVHSLDGMCLHAFQITFNHPGTKEKLSFRALPPDDFRTIMDLAFLEVNYDLV